MRIAKNSILRGLLVQNLGEMNFRFKDKERPQSLAVYLAASLQVNATES